MRPVRRSPYGREGGLKPFPVPGRRIPLFTCVRDTYSQHTPIWPCDPSNSTSSWRWPPTNATATASCRRWPSLTDGELQLEPGTLYRALHRMLKDGWVAESARRPAADQDDERRRYYRLTPAGRRVASAEAERLWRLVSVARAHRLLSRA